ncbi:hypothetical protein [Nonomuraea sp. CA-141351]|uniref:hypothetical protein n=1 Tax=Nonomuraea sp. CA-141351 TaxID=3239996 RepID=UPI003D92F6D4
MSEQQMQERRAFQGDPIVWMFQPTSYEVVTGDRLKQWERDMRSQVLARRGIEIDITIIITTGTATYSFSGPSDSGPDDCDAD